MWAEPASHPQTKGAGNTWVRAQLSFRAWTLQQPLSLKEPFPRGAETSALLTSGLGVFVYPSSPELPL